MSTVLAVSLFDLFHTKAMPFNTLKMRAALVDPLSRMAEADLNKLIGLSV